MIHRSLVIYSEFKDRLQFICEVGDYIAKRYIREEKIYYNK